VTLAETKDGLVVKFYDNKAYSHPRNVSSVDSLDRNFQRGLSALKEQWADASKKEDCPPAVQELLRIAGDLVEAGKYERVVTNSGGQATGVTERLASARIGFEPTSRGIGVPSGTQEFQGSPSPDCKVGRGLSLPPCPTPPGPTVDVPKGPSVSPMSGDRPVPQPPPSAPPRGFPGAGRR
jgi:hypothetical protein